MPVSATSYYIIASKGHAFADCEKDHLKQRGGNGYGVPNVFDFRSKIYGQNYELGTIPVPELNCGVVIRGLDISQVWRVAET